jgi:hypothetical protein
VFFPLCVRRGEGGTSESHLRESENRAQIKCAASSQRRRGVQLNLLLSAAPIDATRQDSELQKKDRGPKGPPEIFAIFVPGALLKDS